MRLVGVVACVVVVVVLAACGFSGGGVPADDSSDPGDDSGGNDMGADAAAIDASDPGTTPDAVAAACPPDYAGGYRLIATGQPWQAAELDCEDDAPGATHLVVIDDDAERLRLTTLVPGDAWVGIVRTPGDPWNWRYVTGGPATYAPWEGSEPNNMSGDQYVAVLRKSSGFLYDYGVSQLVAGVCECDGRAPVDATP